MSQGWLHHGSIGAASLAIADIRTSALLSPKANKASRFSSGSPLPFAEFLVTVTNRHIGAMSEDSPQADNSPEASLRAKGSISGPFAAGGPSPNPRSCVTCRRRKVKCDKRHPCSNCTRAKIECIFPGPGRAPRKSRKPADAELLERLRRLEGVVSSLNAQVEEHEQEAAEREKGSEAGHPECPFSNGKTNPNDASEPRVVLDNSVEGLENRFGRLVVEKGRSRYINNSFWASLNNEVEDLKSVLIEPSDDEDEAHSPNSSNPSSQHQGFVFGYSSSNVDMQTLHPLEMQAHQFWLAFKENVDPLVKVLHIPTFEPVFYNAVAHPDKVPKTLEPLLFAVYYGAVTSTTPEECRERWGEDRTTMLNRYRFGLEQALARANFLYCDEIVILQAFIIFLILLRRNDDARKIWTLTGLVVRIAQTLGIHRDGTHFKLPPFEIESRRRLWWQVCILDARSSEDHGCDPTIVEAQYDTKMPLNVNDDDLHPDMTEFPEERTGFTDMTFCLLRFEVASIFRRILYIPPGPNRCNEFFASLSIAEKEKWITECHQRLEEKYLTNMDMTIPLCWVTATISRLIMSKMWLIVYHPHQRKDGGATLPQETKDKLFITSLENIEYSILLETEARTMKWGWLFRTYVQWHAVAFLLSELCVRTKGEAVERAWRALEATAGRWWFPLNDTSPQRSGRGQGCLWNPLRKLLLKAKAAREREVALDRASMALRDGQMIYPGFSRGMDHNLPPVSIDQPSTENLDRLLRPSAPRLGDSPAMPQSSWPNSPSLPHTHRNFSNGFSAGLGDEPTEAQRSTYAEINGVPRSVASSPGQDFVNLSNFGLDSVLKDVVGGMDMYGNSTYDYPTQREVNAAPGLTNQMASNGFPMSTKPAQANTVNSTATALNAAHGTFGDPMFGNVDFGTMPVPNGQSNGSPMEDGHVDWQVWDDMVAQYGMDVQMANPNTNPASNMGLTNWF
ncbi:hypothetical protein HBH70_008690 [Parastagonospora nodorum]|nr:hypothetical protein HBI10_096660 [Parastagonospora nodorum]KAH4033313.1 hypothetical protein HBI13_009080 [Parastagonospora nodorum]KAH4073364.1 hypothetical protein HBH50_053030 [Parastagonospora nodorum]KAH4099577.1 hypothetical protein HBH48_009130 [Parastagonospora nodorum]KAH4179558.1 hypothetical protein HBH43_018860 [Parastagonospora nodorum]